MEFEELALETRCKLEAMKMIGRWLVGLKDDTISAQKTFRMLNAHITSKGDLHESGKLRYLIILVYFILILSMLLQTYAVFSIPILKLH